MQNKSVLAISLSFILLYFLSSSVANAGKLSDFEKDATTKSKSDKSSSSIKKSNKKLSSSHSHQSSHRSYQQDVEDDGCDSIIICIFEIIFNGLLSSNSSDSDYSNTNSSSSYNEDKYERSDYDNYQQSRTAKPNTQVRHSSSKTENENTDSNYDDDFNQPVSATNRTLATAETKSVESISVDTRSVTNEAAEKPETTSKKQKESLQTNEQLASNASHSTAIPPPLQLENQSIYRNERKSTIQLMATHQSATDNISSNSFQFNLKTENNILLRFATSLFTERGETDELSISKGSIGLNLSNTNQLGIAGGIALIEGTSRTQGLFVELPILIKANKYLSFRAAPAIIRFNNRSTIDIDFSAQLRQKNLGLTVGFRSLQSPNMDISGPYAGILINF